MLSSKPESWQWRFPLHVWDNSYLLLYCCMSSKPDSWQWRYPLHLWDNSYLFLYCCMSSETPGSDLAEGGTIPSSSSRCHITYDNTVVSSSWLLSSSPTWSLTLREERRLRVFENRILMRIYGHKRDENGEWRKLHNEELRSLYRSPNI